MDIPMEIANGVHVQATRLCYPRRLMVACEASLNVMIFTSFAVALSMLPRREAIWPVLGVRSWAQSGEPRSKQAWAFEKRHGRR